eukprot:1181233-Prorocentrum_minimum.AAC.1
MVLPAGGDCLPGSQPGGGAVCGGLSRERRAGAWRAEGGAGGGGGVAAPPGGEVQLELVPPAGGERLGRE